MHKTTEPVDQILIVDMAVTQVAHDLAIKPDLTVLAIILYLIKNTYNTRVWLIDWLILFLVSYLAC